MHRSLVMQEETPPSGNGRTLGAFARKHPVATVIGLGGLGLLGGVELAAGILLGAGIDSLLRRESSHHRHSLREKSRAMIDRMPHTVRERARAVVAAARGERSAPSAPLA